MARKAFEGNGETEAATLRRRLHRSRLRQNLPPPEKPPPEPSLLDAALSASETVRMVLACMVWNISAGLTTGSGRTTRHAVIVGHEPIARRRREVLVLMTWGSFI